MKKKVMILGGSILQLPMILQAKKMGLYTIVLDSNINAIGFKEADESYDISTNDILKAIDIAKKVKPDGIVTMATDMPMRTVAAVGEELGLNTISFKTAEMATNKLLMRNQFLSNHLPIPYFFKIENMEDLLEALEKINGDFILKPANSSGSKGVVLCNTNNIERLSEIFVEVLSFSSTGYILLEEYMRGPEVSVESLTMNGETKVIAITDKKKTEAPYFVEVGHSIPSILNEEIKREIVKITEAAVKSLGIKTGPTHTELIITDNGPKIVEVGARLGGDNITSHLVPLATDVNMVEAVIKIALGETIKINEKSNHASAINYFHSKEGYLEKVPNVRDLLDKDGVVSIEILKSNGELIKQLKSSNDRLGYVITKSDTIKNAQRIGQEVITEIERRLN